MIENFLSGGAGIEPIAGALFAVGVMLLLVEAVGPGLLPVLERSAGRIRGYRLRPACGAVLG